MTFIIAEVGSNWEDFSDCIVSIEQAKVAGADAVKFQLFSFEELYGWNDWKTGELENYHLDHEWLPKLAQHAKAIGIKFMCTAFSPEGVAAVDPFVEMHKVASSDLTYPQLLEAVAKTGKPVLLSCGASSRGDIEQALARLPKERTTLMYCVSAYPARSVDIEVLHELLKACTGPVGFSDHTTDIYGAPVAAARFGAEVIEKHFTAFPHLDTPDRRHSLTPDEFKRMVDRIRGRDEPRLGPTFEESAMFLRHNRRLVAVRDIQPGEVLRFGQNYGAYRTLQDDTRGLSPFLWNHEQYGPEGKRAAVTIGRGKGIGPGDFK